MTKAESAALWRILTVLAGWDEIIDVAEVEADVDYLRSRLPDSALGPFDDDDREQILESLRAQIDCNLVRHEHANFRRIEDVSGVEKAGL